MHLQCPFGVQRSKPYDEREARVPRRDCESSTVGGPIVFTYVLSPEGTAKAVPKVVQLFLLMYYFVLGNVYWTLNLQAVSCLFGTSKMFYPPKGRLLADSKGVHLILSI